MAKKMKQSFKELVDLIGERNTLWVVLRTGMRICLVGVSDYKKQIFSGRYAPCTATVKTHPITYEKIKCIDGGK
jgi:hypothetical protein